MPRKKQEMAKQEVSQNLKRTKTLKSGVKSEARTKNTKNKQGECQSVNDIFSQEHKYNQSSCFFKKIFKRVLFIFGAIVLLGFIAGYFLFYTSGGNHLLKSYAQTKLNQTNLNLELKKLALNVNFIDASLIYDNKLEIRLFGDFNIFTQKMELKIDGKSRSWQYPFSIEGNINGNLKNLVFNLTSNIAKSKTHIIAEMQRYSLQRLFIDAKSVALEEFLPLFVENNVMGGLVNFTFYGNVQTNGSFELDVKNLRALRNLSHFSFLNQVLKNSASGSIKGKLEGRNITHGSGRIISSAYQIDFANIIGDFNKIKWDYLVKIPSLKILNPSVRDDFPVEIEGVGSYDKKWQLTLASQSFDGKIDGEIVNHKLYLNFNDNNIARLLGFLRFPQEIQAIVSGRLDYDLRDYIGFLRMQVDSLKIRHNKFFNLIRRYSGFDIQKEQFMPFVFILDIMGHDGVASFNIEGNNFGLESENFKINFYELGIEAPLSVSVRLNENKKAKLNLYLEGNIHSPKTIFDLREILRLDKNILKNLKVF